MTQAYKIATALFMEVNGTLIIQIVIFMTLLLWLSNSLFKPILQLFEEREKRILGKLKLSEEMFKKADLLSKELLETQQKAKTEAKKVLSNLRAQSEQEQREFLANVKLRAKERIEKSQNDLSKQEALIKDILLNEASSLSNEIIKAISKDGAKLI